MLITFSELFFNMNSSTKFFSQICFITLPYMSESSSEILTFEDEWTIFPTSYNSFYSNTVYYYYALITIFLLLDK